MDPTPDKASSTEKAVAKDKEPNATLQNGVKDSAHIPGDQTQDQGITAKRKSRPQENYVAQGEKIPSRTGSTLEGVKAKEPVSDSSAVFKSVMKIQSELDSLKSLIHCEDQDLAPHTQYRKFSDNFSGLQNKLDEEIAKHHGILSTENKIFNSSSAPFTKVCLTGGPCAGKTTAIAHLTERLRERGFVIFTVPEAASMIFGSGAKITLDSYSDPMKIKFQYYLLLLQMMLEDIFFGIASTTNTKNHVIIICDRGLMDGSAYLGPELWKMMIHEFDLNEAKMRDQRYDLVIHLTTAADGAVAFYQNLNNTARSESIDLAIKLDRALIDAWCHHPHFYVVNNRQHKDFSSKLDAVLHIVFKFVGIPLSIKFYKKFIIANPHRDLAALLAKKYDIAISSFDIEDYIFFDEDTNEVKYYRKRRDRDNFLLTKCIKSTQNGKITEVKRFITLNEYDSIKDLKVPYKYYMHKERNTFMYKGNFFMLDTLQVDELYFSILIIQGLQRMDVEIEIPDLIQKNIVKEASEVGIELLSEMLVKTNANIITDCKEQLKVFKE